MLTSSTRMACFTSAWWYWHCEHVSMLLLAFSSENYCVPTRLRMLHTLLQNSHLFWDTTVSLSFKTNNDTQHSQPHTHTHAHTHTHTHNHATQHAGSRKLTSAHTHGYHSENQATCHQRFAYLEEFTYTADTPSPIHCFELWHVLAVTLTSSISQLDSRAQLWMRRGTEEMQRERERGERQEKCLEFTWRVHPTSRTCQFITRFITVLVSLSFIFLFIFCYLSTIKMLTSLIIQYFKMEVTLSSKMRLGYPNMSSSRRLS